MTDNENSNSNHNMRFDNNSSNGKLYPDQFSLTKSEERINSSSSSYVINSNSSHDTKKTDEDLIKDSINIKNPKLEPALININKNDTKILIFIRVLGYNIAYHEANISTKIGEIIEKYINKNGLDEKIKDQFFIGDKRIDNLDKSLKDLNVSPLTIISTK